MCLAFSPLVARVEIDRKFLAVQPIFGLLQQLGQLPEEDYRRTFNLGVGMTLIISPKNVAAAGRILKRLREPFYEIGEVVPQSRRSESRVRYRVTARVPVISIRMWRSLLVCRVPTLRDAWWARLGSFAQGEP